MKTITLSSKPLAAAKPGRAKATRPKPSVVMTGIEVTLPSGHKETLTMKELQYLDDAIDSVTHGW